MDFVNSTFSSKVDEPTYAICNREQFDGAGWPNEAYKVPWLIKQIDAKIVVEIGSWLGASSRIIAKSLPEDGIMVCIDHWLGSSEHRLAHDSVFFDALFLKFLSNTVCEGLTEKILPLRVSSIDAARMLDITPDLIYVDGSHETNAVYADLNAWWPKLGQGGILCGDDWKWPSVRAAVELFAEKNNVTVHAKDPMTFWWIDPKNSRENQTSQLPTKLLERPSIYSFIKDIPVKEISEEVLTPHFFDFIHANLPDSLILIEPKNTISVAKIGSAMERLGKIFLVDCFEFLGNEISHNYDIHPFHQILSNIKRQKITKTVVPIQMFSKQAAQSLNIQSSMIFINVSHYLESVTQHLTAWKNHLTSQGALCGNLGDNPSILEEISQFADVYGFVLEVKSGGFWTLQHVSK